MQGKLHDGYLGPDQRPTQGQLRDQALKNEIKEFKRSHTVGDRVCICSLEAASNGHWAGCPQKQPGSQAVPAPLSVVLPEDTVREGTPTAGDFWEILIGTAHVQAVEALRAKQYREAALWIAVIQKMQAENA